MSQQWFVRFPKVMEMTGASRSSIFRWERSGCFPKRRQLGSHSVGWLSSEVEQWITSREIISSKEGAK